MSRTRKTVRVRKILEMGNHYLESPDSTYDGRVAIAALLSTVLQDANAYLGFRYQSSEYLPANLQTDTSVLVGNLDDSRRYYFVASEL